MTPHTATSTSRTTSPHGGNSQRRIPIKEVCELCGGVTSMTIWRWLHDDALGFPRPSYIARRRYWREADILAWLDAQEAAR